MEENNELIPINLLKEGTIVKIGGYPVTLLDEVKVSGFIDIHNVSHVTDPPEENLCDGEVNPDGILND